MIPNHELFHTLNQLTRHLTNKMNEALKPFGLYSAQWTVIYVLKTKGSLTQKELCHYLSVEAPPMTRTIQRLVKQGYVKQVTGVDKREKLINLTEEALQNYAQWEHAVNQLNSSLIGVLPKPSQRDLTMLLKEWFLKLS